MTHLAQGRTKRFAREHEETHAAGSRLIGCFRALCRSRSGTGFRPGAGSDGERLEDDGFQEPVSQSGSALGHPTAIEPCSTFEAPKGQAGVIHSRMAWHVSISHFQVPRCSFRLSMPHRLLFWVSDCANSLGYSWLRCTCMQCCPLLEPMRNPLQIAALFLLCSDVLGLLIPDSTAVCRWPSLGCLARLDAL